MLGQRIIILLGLAIGLTGCATEQKTLTPLTMDQQGEELFVNNCASCHSGGGNTLNPAKALRHSAKLLSKAAFIAYIRKPGSGMPAYQADEISDSDADVLRQYLVKQFGSGQ